jgi:hypothetical protein
MEYVYAIGSGVGALLIYGIVLRLMFGPDPPPLPRRH